MLRKLPIVLALLTALVLPAAAATSEPFLGTFELDLAASAITRGAPPRSETIVNTAEPGGFRSLLAVVNEKSTRAEIQHFNFGDGFHQTEGSDPRELSFKRAGDNTIEQDTRRNGNVTVHRHITISRDGKTLTYVADGASGNGQKYTGDTRVYRRQ